MLPQNVFSQNLPDYFKAALVCFKTMMIAFRKFNFGKKTYRGIKSYGRLNLGGQFAFL